MAFKALGLGPLVVLGTFLAPGHLIPGPSYPFLGKGNYICEKLQILRKIFWVHSERQGLADFTYRVTARNGPKLSVGGHLKTRTARTESLGTISRRHQVYLMHIAPFPDLKFLWFLFPFPGKVFCGPRIRCPSAWNVPGTTRKPKPGALNPISW